MAISFTLRAAKLPPGTAWWNCTWYAPPKQWNSGWLRPDQAARFEGVAERAVFYATAYDADYNVTADYNPWGEFTLTSGDYRADFAVRRLEAAAPVPVPGKAAPWVLIPVFGGAALVMGALAWLGRRR